MGEVIQFPGAGSQAPGKVPAKDKDFDYPYKVYPMEVVKTAEDRWDPMPIVDWSNMQFLRWYLGAVTSQTEVPVEVRCSRSTGGPYSVRIGNRRPFEPLTDMRVMDILAGVHDAAKYLEGK